MMLAIYYVIQMYHLKTWCCWLHRGTARTTMTEQKITQEKRSQVHPMPEAILG